MLTNFPTPLIEFWALVHIELPKGFCICLAQLIGPRWSKELIEMRRWPPVASPHTHSQTFQNPGGPATFGPWPHYIYDYNSLNSLNVALSWTSDYGLCFDEGDHCDALEQTRISRIRRLRFDTEWRKTYKGYQWYQRIISPPAKPRKSLLPIALLHPRSKRKARRFKEVQTEQPYRRSFLAKEIHT